MELTFFGKHRKELKDLLSPCFPGCIFSFGPGQDHPNSILLSADSAVHPAILAISDPDEALPQQAPDTCVVTCGMSPRDSVSCCSVSDGCTVISIVRELPIIGGGFVDVQDICLPTPYSQSASQIALLVATCLCAGIPPAQLAPKIMPNASIRPHGAI